MTISHSDRPLSPHLQVYKPQITSVMSITHRATGVFLSIGSLLLVAWLYAAAYNDSYFNTLNGYFSHIIGQIALGAWTLAFYYHLGNGIRHMFWDMGRGFELKNVTRSGLLVILFAVLATAATWCAILTEKGVM